MLAYPEFNYGRGSQKYGDACKRAVQWLYIVSILYCLCWLNLSWYRNTEVTPESKCLKTRTTWNPNEKFEQILSRNPNAALESERPARLCMFVCTFPQRSATHTSDPKPSASDTLAKGIKRQRMQTPEPPETQLHDVIMEGDSPSKQ